MATNRFFDEDGLQVTDGQLAKAIQLNSLTDETNRGFELVEVELNALILSANLARQWAANDQGDEPDPTNYPGKYSALANAIEAEGWTSAPGGSTLTADGVTTIPASAKEWQELSEKWAQEAVDVEVEPGLYSSYHFSVKCSEIYDNVITEGDTQVARVIAEGDTQEARIIAEGDTQDARVEAEGDTQVARVIAEGDTQDARVEDEGDTQVARVIAEGDTQEQRVTDEGDTQVARAAAEADRAEDEADRAEAEADDAEQSAAEALASELAAKVYSEIAEAAAGVNMNAILLELAGPNAVEGVFIYDTSKDSDGGAWRKRCQHLSWYNEELNTARRGRTREFPALSLIVNYKNGLSIWDLTEADAPMWMTFQAGLYKSIFYRVTQAGAVAMMNGRMMTSYWYNAGAYSTVDFLLDYSYTRVGDATRYYARFKLTDRDLDITTENPTFFSQVLTGRDTYNIDVQVFPGAAVDQTTQLPVPSFALANNGGIGVIDPPNRERDYIANVNTSASPMRDAWFGDDGELFGTRFYADRDEVVVWKYPDWTTNNAAQDRAYTDDGNFNPAILSGASAVDTIHGAKIRNGFIEGNDSGVTLYHEDRTTPESGMNAYITDTYNTGWMQGDIKLATLSDSVEGTLGTDVTTEYLANNIDAVDPEAEWTLGTGWSISGGNASADGTQAGNTILESTDVLSTATDYRLQYSLTDISAGLITAVWVGSQADGTNRTTKGIYGATIGSSSGQSISITGDADFVGDVDDVYAWLAGDEEITGGTVGDEGEDWTLSGGGWTVGSGVITYAGPGSYSDFSQNIGLSVGETYRVQSSVISLSGTHSLNLTGSDPIMALASGIASYTFINDTDASLRFYNANTVGSGVIDDVYLWLAGTEEITGGTVGDEDEGWTLTGNWAIGSGVASRSGVAARDFCYYTFSEGVNFDIFRTQFSVPSINSGSIRVRVGGSGEVGEAHTTIGLKTENMELNGNKYALLDAYAGDFDGTCDDFYMWAAGAEELDATWVNFVGAAYTTFTSSGSDITSAISTTDAYASHLMAGLVSGDIYEVTIDLTHNSGPLPIFYVGDAAGAEGGSFSTPVTTGVHKWTFVYQAGREYLWAANVGGAADFSATMDVRKITDLIENGEMSSDRVWTTGTMATITGGKLNVALTDTTTQYYWQTVTLDPLKTYIAQIQVDAMTVESIRVSYYDGANFVDWISTTSAGVFKGVVNPSDKDLNRVYVQVKGVNAETATIDNVKLYEAELVNGTWQPVGNLISNPGFEGIWDDTDWTVSQNDPSYVDVREGYVRVYNTAIVPQQTLFTQPFATEVGKAYELRFNVDPDGTASSAFVGVGTTEGGYNIFLDGVSPAGTGLFTFKAVTTTTWVTFSNNTTASNVWSGFNDITVREITDVIENGEMSSDRAWTKGTGWTISGGSSDCDGTQTGASGLISTTGTFQDNTTYIINYEVEVSAGWYDIFVSGNSLYGVAVLGQSTTGVFSVVVTPTSGGASTPNQIEIRANSAFVGSIHDIKVYEAELVDGTWQPVGNLISNPGFEGKFDSTAWDTSEGGILEAKEGEIQLTNGADSSGRMYQGPTQQEIGSTYEISMDTGDGSVNAKLRAGYQTPYEYLDVQVAPNSTITATYKVTSALPTWISVYVNSTTTGDDVIVNNFTIRKITDVIENGEFSSDRVWDLGTGSTIASNQLTVNSSDQGFWSFQDNIFESDTTYILQADVDSVTSGSGVIAWYEGVTKHALTWDAAGVHRAVFTAGTPFLGRMYVGIEVDSVATQYVLNSIKVYEAERVDGTYQPVGNLISNPSFEGNLLGTDWVNYTDGYWETYEGVMQVSADDNAGCYQEITTEVGELYQLTFDVPSGGDGVTNVRIGTVAGTGDVANDYSPVGTGQTLSFRSTAVTMYVALGTISAGGKSYCENIYLKGSQNLIENGEFSSDRDWTLGTGWTISGGNLVGTAVDSGQAYHSTTPLTRDKNYKVTFDYVVTVGNVTMWIGSKNTGTITGSGSMEWIYESEGNPAPSKPIFTKSSSNFTGTIDNVVITELDVPDRTYNANDLQVVGELTTAAVATGAELVAYSGFTVSDYLKQSYNADLDFGTGDFYVMGWIKLSDGTASNTILDRSTSGAGVYYKLDVVSGKARMYFSNGDTVSSTSDVDTDEWVFVCFSIVSNELRMSINGVQEATTAGSSLNITNATATLFIGIRGLLANVFVGSLALIRTGASAPTATQILKMYEDERLLFREDAGALLSGIPVSAVEQDDEYDEILIGNGTTVDTFTRLNKTSTVDYTTTPVLNISSSRGRRGVSAGVETVATTPFIDLREEVESKEQHIALLSRPLYEFETAAAQTSYTLPQGYYPVSAIGLVTGAIPDATLLANLTFDGFAYTVSGVTSDTWYIKARRI